MLTRRGKYIESSPEVKRALTVRAVENSMGIRPPAFKVYRVTKSGEVCVPRYYGPTAEVDRRPEPVQASIQFVGKLRDSTSQNEAFRMGLQAFDTIGGGVLSLDAGFGKTTVSLAFAGHLKVRTMIIVHKEFLANQWRERIQQFCPGATVGRVQQDVFEVENDFVIAMIQTLCSREYEPNALDSIGFLIVDEAHHIGAAAFSQSMFKLCPKYTLGLTATPERKDGLTNILYWFMGPEFFRLQRTGQKSTRVEPIFYDDPAFRECPPTTKFGKINMAGMITQLTELPKRNSMLLGIVHRQSKTRKILLLTDRREQCFWLNEQLGDSGLYIGGMSEKELAESAEKRIIVATFSMAQEGLDIPALDTLVMVTPHSDVCQAVGRIMRETPGKVNSPLIFDIVDQWSVFHSMYRKRVVFYKKSGFMIQADEEPASVLPKGKCLL